MSADILTGIPDKILSECGLVSALLVIGIMYLAVQLAKTRAGWEADRAGWMQIIRSQDAGYDKMVISNTKLEGILMSLSARPRQ